MSKVFGIAMMMPWVRFIFPSLTGYNKVVGNKIYLSSKTVSSEVGGTEVHARCDTARDERTFERH